jgi:glutathione peroxidase
MTTDLHAIPFTTIDGRSTSLDAYRGKVLLVVNVASKCGLTKQYSALEQLYRDHRAQGFEILAFPANDFKGQEPGSDEEIQAFCTSTYDVTFPLFSKISVVGADQHPLYRELTRAQPAAQGDGAFRERLRGYGIEPNAAPDVLWNFEKFLIDRQGNVVGRFSPDMEVTAPELSAAVDEAIATA